MSTNEIELAFLAKVTKPEGYEQAETMEMHDQCEYRLPDTEDGKRRGKLRIRKTTKDSNTHYEEVLKCPHDPDSTIGDEEVPSDITEAYFNTWQKVFQAPMIRKIRYIFLAKNTKVIYNNESIEVPLVKFEVDRFLSAGGSKSVWAKIDIEVQDIVEVIKQRFKDVTAAQIKIDFDSLGLGITDTISMATEDPTEREAIKTFFKTFEIPYKNA